MLTGYDDIGYVRTLQKIGALGYLDKSVSGGQIVAAIRAVAAGMPVLISEATRNVAMPMPLTAREHEVLALVAEGRRNKEISQHLQVSDKTVEFHVTNLFAKLGVQSRTELAIKAHELGLLPTLGTDWHF